MNTYVMAKYEQRLLSLAKKTSFPRRRESSTFFPAEWLQNKEWRRVASESTFLDSRLRGNDEGFGKGLPGF
jgi:hypothetical protein